MNTTTFYEGHPTLTLGGHTSNKCPLELVERYDSLLQTPRMSWTEHHRVVRELGRGGQGVVFLSDRRGTDGFTLPVALKIFSPKNFDDARGYDEAMCRIANVAARVAQIQQDNLLDVQNFVDRNRIRIMEMEWIDGYDLSQLLTRQMLKRTRELMSAKGWEHLTNVIVTEGPQQPRLKPGVAISVIRECLAGLAALHRNDIVHGDIKPSNIMIKRTGNAKIVDIGSAVALDDVPPKRTVTPTYAAPEVLESGACTPRSDLASLGYVLIEMLSGKQPFAGLRTCAELLEAKRFLAQRLPQILPPDVVVNELLMNFCRGLIAPDPNRRFGSAEAADMEQKGAASFQRQLIKGDLASEYENDLRLWLEQLD
ncbi:MAG TPA: serine/threonine-protein kinase [Pirellulales bacterium]|nr:serine/threonine-protein kinase [Pirellulales bacterium]